MPLYEYHCEKCGRFETLQKFSDGPLSVCPTCGATVERLISAPAFQFKGTGWYVTDYGKAGSDSAGSKETEAKGTDSASSEPGKGSDPKGSGPKGSEPKGSEPKGSGPKGSGKEASTPTSADSKSSTNSPPKEGTASAAPALAPAANTSQ